MSDIAKAGVTAAKWSVITTIARFGLQLVAQVILARLLGPDAYGIFGMGLVVFTLSNFLATFGFSWGLAQLHEITDEDIRFAFTWQMIVGLTAGALMYLASPLAVSYFHDERVLSLTRWMALACVINAAGSVSGNLMRRTMSFKASGLIQFGSYFLGYIAVGIPMAFLGAGVNALVAAWMIQSLFVWLAGYYLVRHPVRPLFRSAQGAQLTKIGSAVFFTNMGNWLINNLDRLLIGRFLNAHAMGVYTVGYNLANMPNTLLIGALQPVFLAAGARVQNEASRLRSAYSQVSAIIWVLLLPFFVMLALMSPDVVRLLYGPAWAEATPVLQILFLSMPAFVTWGMSTPVLWNSQRARYEILLQLPLLPLAALAYYFFARDNVQQAAVVAGGVLAARGAVMATAASKILGLGARQWLQWMARGVLLSAIAVALPLVGHRFYHDGMPAILGLLADGVLGFGTLGVVVLACPQVLGADAAAMLVRFVPRLKGRFARTLSL